MEFSMEWNVICRICLQEGDMISIFEKDENSVAYNEKVEYCTSIKIKRGINLPEQICLKCVQDLNTAYTFRNSCESTDVVLQSFMQGNIVSDLIMSAENGEIYKYKPPEGLKVKRIRKHKISETDNKSITEDADSQNDEDIKFTIPSADDSQFSEPTDPFENVNCIDKHKPEFTITVLNGETTSDVKYEFTETRDNCIIRPVNNFKPKNNSSKSTPKILQVVSPQTIETKADGTTIIRVRRPATEKPLKICDICGNTYKHKHALETHMRRHRNEKPFACEICGRAFVLNVELRCHMRTHTGQKPYACRFCDRRFSDFGSRVKHERTHTGERPYACETCGKAFAYSYGLSSHMLTHTGEKPFECEKCGRRFTKKHHLKAHLNTHARNPHKFNDRKPMFVGSEATVATENSIYETNEEEFVDMLTVLATQPKIDESVVNKNTETNTIIL